MFVWYQTSIIFFAGLVTASFLFYWVPIEILRYFVIVLLAMQIWLEVNTGQNSFLTSPLFLLSSIALFFFSFLQGMTHLFTEYPAYLSENPGNSIVTVSGSLAERYIVVFSMIIFIAHASLTFYIKVNLKSEQHMQIKQTPKLSIIFFIAIAFITIINVIYFNSPFDRGSNTYQTLRSVSPPLQAFMLVYLVRQAIERGKIFNILLAMVFLFSFSGLLFILEGKIPIFIGLAISLYWMRLVGISIKSILVGGLLLGVLLTGGLCVNFLLKYTQNSYGWDYHLDKMMVSKFPKLGDKSNPNKLGNHLSENSDLNTMEGFIIKFDSIIENSVNNTKKQLKVVTDTIQNIFALKLIWRQAEVINCFNNVIFKHWDETFIFSKQLFWLKALVPRIIWTGKPNISKGQDYYHYCGWKVLEPRHSFSITLLGQPIVYGGWMGLFLHAGILLVVLCVVTWLGHNSRGLSALSIAALLPWLIAFDQDLTMYIANATKFFLVMLPLIYIARIAGIYENSSVKKT